MKRCVHSLRALVDGAGTLAFWTPGALLRIQLRAFDSCPA
jgi:hypothetical protein